MAEITLHRADRILKSIDKALKEHPPVGTVKISVFGEPEASLDAARTTLRNSVSTAVELLRVRSTIRAVAAVAQSACGLSTLLAEQASCERLITMLETLPGVGPHRPPEEEDIYSRRRKPKQQPEPLGAEAVFSLSAAAKARYESAGEGAVTEVEASAVLPEDVSGFRSIVLDARRRLDGISDRLRSLNSTVTVEVEDAVLEMLRKASVI